ncbi:MAG: DUF4215 domain-containing protein [Candidatus Binatia bacterium]
MSVPLALLVWTAPAQATVADDLCAAVANPCVVNATIAITPGSMLDFSGRTLELGGQSTLDVGAGVLIIDAAAVRLLPGSKILGRGVAAGGNITIRTTGAIDIQGSGPNKGKIDVSTDGDSGIIDLQAGGNVTIAGQLVAVGSAQYAGGGTIDILAGGSIVVAPSGDVVVTGGTQGDGGEVFMSAGVGIDLQNVIEASGGDFGGGTIELTARGGDVIVRQQLNVPGGGFSGDGGIVSLTASGSVQLLAPIDGHAAGDSEDGSGSGGDVDIRAQQAITITGTLSLTAAPPDGEGGSVTLDAGTTITQNAPILVEGQGIDGCGGSVAMTAGGGITLHRFTMNGGSCGGGYAIIRTLGDLAVPQNINADGATFGPGGSVLLAGRNVSITNAVRAVSSDAEAGSIRVEGCNVTIGPGAELRTIGIGGENTIVASGQASIQGDLLSSTGTIPGTNRVLYRNPALPPVFAGATVSPAAVLTVDATLPPCPAAGAVCGDGALDPGEACDDGNNVACDGCSASCRSEGCGNGRAECAEQCDNGAANGTAGNACASDCTIIPTPGGLQIVPGGRTSTACQVEWVIKNPGGEIVDGFPSTQQRCYDGDPGCDSDEADDGKCTFDVAVCLAANDTRIASCQPQGLKYFTLKAPSLLNAVDPNDLANGAVLRDAVAAFGLPVRDGSTVVVPGVPLVGRDVCTGPLGLTVPHVPGLVGSRSIEAASRDLAGSRMRHNRVDLICVPNPSVCGNGVVEIAEQCDDGNIDACDGCTPTCRRELCGNGIAECGEECDDGPGNGSPQSQCTTSCAEKVPPLRIPGGGSPLLDCLVEYALNTTSPTLDRSGLPAKKQGCVDNDPACDLDPTPGTCRLKAWVCLGGADPRLGCLAQTVATLDLVKPSLREVGPLADVRQALQQRLDGISLPVSGLESCTKRIEVAMAAGKRPLTMSVKARDPIGKADRDTLKLRCLPPPSS